MVTAKSFNILATSLSVLYNYFDSLNKIIFRSVVKFLNTSEKSFFPFYNPYRIFIEIYQKLSLFIAIDDISLTNKKYPANLYYELI